MKRGQTFTVAGLPPALVELDALIDAATQTLENARDEYARVGAISRSWWGRASAAAGRKDVALQNLEGLESARKALLAALGLEDETLEESA